MAYCCVALFVLVCLYCKANAVYRIDAPCFSARKVLNSHIYLASPAIVPAGRNIAFESGNAISNAPASYLTMLDCCESDAAIADRIAVGQTRCRIIKHNKGQEKSNTIISSVSH